MSKRTFLILLFLVLLVNFTGLLCDIFMQDSVLYAIISKNFSISGNYIDLYFNGADWLDKPHFPFWVCGFFIDIFGANTFAYKFPSLLFFAIGMIYTYKLAKRMYSVEVAYFAVLILASSVHIILSNNDVRAEAILLGLIMGGMYYLYKLISVFSLKNLLLSSVFCAAAVMTKGVFVLIIFYSAVFLNMLAQKEFRKIFDVRWLLALILTFLFISPEIYAVYHQFDLHPEKVVFGKNNVSGVKFFLWDSQFGRFFNSGPIKGDGGIFFFTHTMLWAFAPWAIIGFTSLVITARKLWKKVRTQEYITFFGFLIMFILFSVSKFQLPHYTNILFPLISIMVAALIIENKNRFIDKIINISINIYTIVFAIVIILLEYFFRTDRLVIALMILLAMIILFVYTNSKKSLIKHKFVVMGILSSVLLFLYLNLCFYPKLEKYQSGSQIAFYLHEHYPNEDVAVNFNSKLLEYYSKNNLQTINSIDNLKGELSHKNKIVAVNETFYTLINESGLDFNVIKIFDSFVVTRLNKDFLYHKTREKTISHIYLLEIKAFVDNE